MEYTRDQLEVLRKHRGSLTVKGLLRHFGFLFCLIATTYGLVHTTYLASPPPLWMANLVKFAVVIEIVGYWCFVPFMLIACVMTLYHREAAIRNRSVATYDLFMGMQRAGLNIPDRFRPLKTFSDLVHLAFIVALGACGWTWSAIFYLPCVLLMQLTIWLMLSEAEKYFSSLTRDEIRAYESGQEPEPEKSPYEEEE